MGSRRDYTGTGIVVHWETSRCIHAAECVRGLPAVFDPDRRPWIDAGAATAAELAEVIRRCPSGALIYTTTGPDVAAEAYDGVEVRVVANGPLVVRDPMRLTVPGDGESVETLRASLCRCGASANKPFCDGTHRTNGFEG